MILIRHGQSEFNVHFSRTGIDPGIVDPHLTATGREQVREAVAGVSRRGNAREAVRVHGAHQKVSRAERSIAGEDAPGPVCAVRRGRQADDEHPRLRVAEARHRPAPIDLMAVRGFLLRGDALAVGRLRALR